MSVDGPAVSYADATAVKALDSHTYEVELQDDWCIGAGECWLNKFHLHPTTDHRLSPPWRLCHLMYHERSHKALSDHTQEAKSAPSFHSACRISTENGSRPRDLQSKGCQSRTTDLNSAHLSHPAWPGRSGRVP